MSIFTHPDFAGGAYDELSFWSSRFGSLLFEHLELRRGVRGLDVACGSGFPLFELAHAHGPSSHFTGVDLWHEGLLRAHRKNGVFALRNVALVRGDAHALPFPDASFDLVTSNLGVNNFDDPPRAMRECFRVARSGARVAVTTNLTGHFAPFYRLFRDVLCAEGRADLLPALDAQEAHRGTRATIERLLTDAGFELTQVIESEFHLGFADGTAMLRHPLVGFFLDGWRGVTADENVWRAIERRLNDASPVRMPVPMLYAQAVRP